MSGGNSSQGMSGSVRECQVEIFVEEEYVWGVLSLMHDQIHIQNYHSLSVVVVIWTTHTHTHTHTHRQTQTD